MSAPLTQFTITEAAPGYWRVTFNNPPINLCDPETLIELQQIVGLRQSLRRLAGCRFPPDAGADGSADVHRRYDAVDHLPGRDHRVDPGSHARRGFRDCSGL
jgi:hypothetical protein